MTLKEIGTVFGVGHRIISNIWNNKAWVNI